MSNLIKRFKENLQLAGYAKRSIDSYVSSVLLHIVNPGGALSETTQ